MAEVDRESDLRRIEAEEQRVKQVEQEQARKEQERLQAQGRIERER